MVALENKDMVVWKRGIAYFFLFLITLMFITIHVNSKPGQTQLTYGVWVLMPAVLLGTWKYMDHYSRVFMGLIVAYGSYSLFIYWVHGDLREPFIRSQLIYFIAIGVGFTLAAFRPTKKFLMTVLLLATIGSFSVVLQEYFMGGVRGNRAHGIPIVFGNISVLSGSLCLLLMMDKAFSGFIWKMAAVVAFIFGSAASLWSQTRGGWGTFLIVFSLLVYAVLFFANDRNNKTKKKVIIGMACSLALLTLVAANNDIVQSRFIQAKQNVEDYWSGENKNTSLGLRFEMWKAAVSIVKTDPFTGVGPDQYAEVKDEMVDSGYLAEFAKNLEHAHNDYLWVSANKGLIGLVLYLSVFFYLIWQYLKLIRAREQLYLGLSGLLVCFSYMLFSMSDIFFSVKIGIGYFIILNLLLLRVIAVDSENEMTEQNIQEA